MRYLLFVLTFCVYGFGLTQTYYLTGRPFTFERNNAIKEVGSAWGITVMYAGSDVVEQLGLDKINKDVNRVDSIMALTRGKEWLSNFYSEVDKQQATHELIRHHLHYANIPALSTSTMDAQVVERKIILRHIKRKTYLASIISIVNTETIRCDATYRIKWNRMKKMRLQSQCAVPYQFPENGIIIK